MDADPRMRPAEALERRPSLDDWDLARKQAELDRLEAAIARREQDLRAFEDRLAAFHVRYMSRLARPYAELDELEAQVAERAAAVRPDDAAKRNKAARLRAQVEARWGGARPPAEPAVEDPAAPDAALRQAYRALTKRIHPDLAAGDPAEAGRRQAAMIRANAAYAAGDLATLTWLAERWGEPVAATPDVDEALDRLAARITGAGERLARADAAYAAAEATDLARLMRRADAAEAEGRDLLGKLAAEVEAAQRDLRKRLQQLSRRLAKADRG